MRKDRLSSYQAKKLKLKQIKELILEYDRENTEAFKQFLKAETEEELFIAPMDSEELISKIREIVKDE